MLRLHRCRNEGITVHPIRESHTESENDERALERVLDPDINNYIVKEDEETIKFQLAAYGFVEISNENGRLSLTELGTRTLLNLKAVRKADAVHKIA
jgi:hypothetical protein